jgi:hypothetical protein
MHIVKVFVFPSNKKGGFVKCVYCGYIFSVTDHQPVSQVDIIILLDYIVSLLVYLFFRVSLSFYSRSEGIENQTGR